MSNFKKIVPFLLVFCLILAFFMPAGQVAATEETAEDTFDPYVFVWNRPYEYPNHVVGVIPEYYKPYARSIYYNSPHWVLSFEENANTLPTEQMVYLFNLVNYAMLVQDENEAPEGPYASFTAYCSDVDVRIIPGSAYRRLDLEQGYFCYDSDGNYRGTERAEKIRAVFSHTIPTVTDMEQLQAAANAYLTETYGEDAVLVENLTGAEALAASQSAIWHFSNEVYYPDPFPYWRTEDFSSWGEARLEAYLKETISSDGLVDMYEQYTEQTAINMNGIYNYLINLPGEAVSDKNIGEDSIRVTGMAKSGAGNNCRLSVFFTVEGTIDEDDDLRLQASFADQSAEYALGSVSELDCTDDGVYAVSFTGLDETELTPDAEVSLQLDGTQTIQSACFFEAKPVGEQTGRRTSQNLVGYESGAAPVQCAGAFAVGDLTESIQITKVDSTTGKPLAGVAFDLYANTGSDSILVGTYLTDENGQIRIDSADAGYEYYFVENTALPGYDSVEGQYVSGDVIENAWQSGTLLVSKKVVNSSEAQADEQFTFKITLDMSSAPLTQSNISWMTEEYLMSLPKCDTELDWIATDEGYQAQFTLEADGQIAISGIPVGTTYTLEEILNATDGYIVTTLTDSVKEGSGTVVSGTVAAQNAVVYTNTVGMPVPETGDFDLTPCLLVLLMASGAVLIARKLRFL